MASDDVVSVEESPWHGVCIWRMLGTFGHSVGSDWRPPSWVQAISGKQIHWTDS